MRRLFIAIDLPENVKGLLVPLCGGLPGARWTAPENLRLTLRFIGEVDGANFADIHEALCGIRVEPFAVSLEGLGFFPPRQEPHILWVGVRKSEALSRLRNKIERVLTQLGLPADGQKFAPHVTLARLSGTPSTRVADYLSFNGLLPEIAFDAEEFCLFSSHLGSEGAIHRIEASYSLQFNG